MLNFKKEKIVKHKIVPNYFLVIMAVIIGTGLYKEFDFQTLKFENPALAIVYLFGLSLSIGFMIKKKN
jgi:hypothetical protein